MGAISRLLERWGFVKLNDFGLALTPDRRVATMRGAILDDGFGSRIVGWREGDHAALELQPWTQERLPMMAAIPEPPRTRAAPTTPPPLPPRARQAPITRDRLSPPAPPVFQPAPPPPAPAAQPPEEEWEWQIAMARARAIAADIEADQRPPATPPPPPPKKGTLPPPIANRKPFEEDDWETQIAVARQRAQVAVDFVEEAETIAVSSEHSGVRPRPQLVRELGPAPQPRASVQMPAQNGNARTVIPVPQLPAAADPSAVARSMPLPRRAPEPRPSLRVASRR